VGLERRLSFPVSALCSGKVKQKQVLPLVLMVVFALTRWPGLMPQNFSAVYGLVFCAGVYFAPGQRWIMPLGTLLVTDLILNIFYYHTAPFNWYMAVNYSVYVVLIWIGKNFGSKAAWWRLVFGGLFGSLVFYFLTNTASWLQNPEYQKNLFGWIQALTVGTPGYPHTWEFFRNTLLSGGLFTGLFAGAMKLGEAREPQEEVEEAPVAAEDAEESPSEAKA
jgi:hypothetical protein